MSTPTKDSLLRKSLRANAVFSSLCAIVLLVGFGPLSALLGGVEAVPLLVTGGVLALYALDLWRTARLEVLPRGKVIYFLVMDVLWVVGSAVLVWGVALPFTTAGRWLVIGVADVVAIFAGVQGIGLRRANQSTDAAPAQAPLSTPESGRGH